MSDSRRPPRPSGSNKGRRPTSGGAKKSSAGGAKKSYSAGEKNSYSGGAKKSYSSANKKTYSGSAKKGRSSGAQRGSARRGDRFATTASPPPNPRTGSGARGAERSGRPPPRGGPRDPLVDEVRASAPRTKQEAAVAAFEHARDLLQRGRDGGAAEAAAEAKRLAPRSGSVREVLGVALYRSGRYRDALRELQAYRRMTGRLDQNHLIADSYRGLGMPEKAVPLAVEAVRSRLREEPRAEAAVVGASALADLGRYDEAIGLLRGFPTRRDEAQPWDLRIWYVAGDVLVRAGRTQEAAEEFRRVIRYDPGAFDAAERLAALPG